jgi:microcompartment protein CcmK/EutM
MQLARVVGTVVASEKDEKMVGVPFLVLRDLDLENRPAGGSIVAADPIGADRGEVVIYSKGSSARQTEITRDRPNDAVICGIVDQWEVGGVEKYRKN